MKPLGKKFAGKTPPGRPSLASPQAVIHISRSGAINRPASLIPRAALASGLLPGRRLARFETAGKRGLEAIRETDRQKKFIMVVGMECFERMTAA